MLKPHLLTLSSCPIPSSQIVLNSVLVCCMIFVLVQIFVIRPHRTSWYLQEARLAIEYIVIPGGEPVELLPRCSEIIARQLELVESYQLAAETSGTELNSRLQILPVKIKKKSSSQKNAGLLSSKQMDIDSLVSESRGASVSRLPLLPE